MKCGSLPAHKTPISSDSTASFAKGELLASSTGHTESIFFPISFNKFLYSYSCTLTFHWIYNPEMKKGLVDDQPLNIIG